MMKKYIVDKLTKKHVWVGIISTITGGGFLLEPAIAAKLTAILLIVAGIGIVLTKDYAKTKTNIDDIVYAFCSAVIDSVKSVFKSKK